MVTILCDFDSIVTHKNPTQYMLEVLATDRGLLSEEEVRRIKTLGDRASTSIDKWVLY